MSQAQSEPQLHTPEVAHPQSAMFDAWKRGVGSFGFWFLELIEDEVRRCEDSDEEERFSNWDQRRFIYFNEPARLRFSSCKG